MPVLTTQILHMNTTYKCIEYTKQDIAAMREWIADCEWPNLDTTDIKQLSALQVLKGIERNYEGGLNEFMQAIQ